MSNHKEKYPGLYAGAKAANIGYMTALGRVRRGMTVEEALAKPVKHNIAYLQRITGLLVHRPAPEAGRVSLGAGTLSVRQTSDAPWKEVAKVSSFVFQPKKKRGRPVGHHFAAAPDNSPLLIQKLRAAFCNRFIATGELDGEMQNQLTAYALSVREKRNAARRSDRSIERVPNEPAPSAEVEGPAHERHDGHWDDPTVADDVNARIYHFIRS
jgi:hypothetical protein